MYPRSIPIAILTCFLWISTNNAMLRQQHHSLYTKFLDILGASKQQVPFLKTLYEEIVTGIPLELLDSITASLKKFDTQGYFTSQELSTLLEQLKSLDKKLDVWNHETLQGRFLMYDFPIHTLIVSRIQKSLAYLIKKVERCYTDDAEQKID
jgi:hypothetical protein